MKPWRSVLFSVFDNADVWIKILVPVLISLAVVAAIVIFNWRTHHWISLTFSLIVAGFVVYGLVGLIRHGTPRKNAFTGHYVVGSQPKPRAYAVRAIAIACWAAFVVTTTVFQKNFVDRWSVGSREVLVRHEWWRIATSSFLHASIVHIMFNMSALWFLGTMIEAALGTWRFVGIYSAAAFGAGLTVVAFGQERTIGASGAIYGLVGAVLALGVHARREGFYRPAMMYLKSGGWMLAANLVFTIAVPFISLAAHCGGAIAGFITALLLRPPVGLREVWGFAQAFPSTAHFSYDGDKGIVHYNGPARYALEAGLVALDNWATASNAEALPPAAPLRELDLDRTSVSCWISIDQLKERTNG